MLIVRLVDDDEDEDDDDNDDGKIDCTDDCKCSLNSVNCLNVNSS